MAAGKRYSAGAIFLQVVPVFANVQRAIEDEAKNIDRALGDQMEKSGDKAGRRAGKAASKSMREEVDKGARDLSGSFEREFHKNIDGINKSLDGIDTKRLSNNLRRELTEVKKELAGLKTVDITAEPDFKRVHAALATLEGRLQGVRDSAKVIFRADIDQALRGFAKIEAAKEAISDPVEIKVKTDFRAVERELTSFEKSFKKTAERAAGHLSGSMNKEVKRIRDDLIALQNLRIGVDISSNRARFELAELTAELEAISANDVNIDVKVDSARAFSELAALELALKKIDGEDVNIDVKTDGAERSLLGLTRGGDDAANSFRSFNIILFAVATLGPALVPVLGAIAGGLLALGPAAAVAGAGLGAVLIGFSGIGGALTALNNKQDQMTRSTQTAAKTEESSARQVANARRSAARAVESALDRQKAAQERYQKSIKDVKEAEQALAEARAAHKDDGADINRQIKDNGLAIDQALLDSFNATVNFNAVSSDGSATNAEQEQARINMEQAKLRLEELRAEQKKLAAEKKKWDKEGVNGTDAVKSAQDHLNEALKAQKDAYKALGDAARDVDRARADGARAVSEAIASQAQALGQVNAQQAAVDAAFSKLGGSGKKFALFLFTLRQGFYDFRDDIQTVLLPAVQQAMEGFFASDSAKAARAALVTLAGSFGQFVKALSVSFQGPAWSAFFHMLADLGPDIQAAYGGAFIKFMEAMASILTTLAPFALKFALGVEKLATSFANWAASKSGQDSLIKFMNWATRVGPDVLDFLASFANFAVQVAKGLAEWGDTVLGGITGMLDALAGLDPKILSAIVTTLFVLISASQSAYAVMNLVNAGMALLLQPIGLLVFAILGIAAGLIYLYKTNEDFADFVDKAWKKISKAFKEAWKEIQPALSDLWDSLNSLWKDVLQPFMEWLAPILLWLVVTLIPLVAKFWAWQIRNMALIIDFLVLRIELLAKVFVWLWNKILKPVWGAMRTAAEWLWKRALKPAFDGISNAWHGMGTGMKWVWNRVLKPVFDFITNTALPGLKDGFQATVDGISTLWNGLKRVVGAPIKFVLDTIINNGLIDGFNKVAGWVHAPKLDHIPIPKALQSYATGGVMPGYTPGRDVHSFVSPTAGRLELSGGEAVMRPEWTAAMGPAYVDWMNKLARSGGVNAIRKAMDVGSYWMGGVLPLPGGKFRKHEKGYKGFAGDFNWGSGYDDYGRPVDAWKSGVVAQENYVGDRSYGRWVVLNHKGGQNSLYAHLSKFGKFGVGDKVAAGQTVGYVGDLGNTGNPPTSHLHFEINGGSVDYADTASNGGGGIKAIPGWLLNVVKDPLAAVKGWITKPWTDASDMISQSPITPMVKKIPGMLAKKTVDKMWDIIPGWVKTGAGWAGNAAEWAVGGVKNAAGAVGDAVSGVGGGIKGGADAVGDFLGLYRGGILPYNGTMKYDNGGYLPPGMTNVVNLTGKPEPVFTSNQWDNMDGGGSGETYHYEPHFEGSDLTANDVAGDVNSGFRRLKRRGKYGGNN